MSPICRYSPSSFVVISKLRARPPWNSRVMVAPSTTWPAGSVMTPKTRALFCAAAGAAAAMAMATTGAIERRNRLVSNIVCSPSGCVGFTRDAPARRCGDARG